jgi:dUTP pyrophosphatase
VIIRVKRLRPEAKMPTFATPGSVGADLYACLSEPVEIRRGVQIIPTGLVVEMPPGIFAQICPRSGLTKAGLLVQVGTLDPDYRGEIGVMAFFNGRRQLRNAHVINPGDRIAQLVFHTARAWDFTEVDYVIATERGDGGFGSSGR